MGARPLTPPGDPVGFIGLGDLGRPMVRRLLSQGREVVAWNRSAAPLAELAAEGAVAASSPAEVGARSRLIGLCLTSHAAVEQVAFGPKGLLSRPGPKGGRVVADFSTGSPDAAAAFGRRAAGGGDRWVDAPVSGGPPGAAAGALVVFAGGDAGDVAALDPLFSALARRVTRLGAVGAGQTAKICHQSIVAGTLVLIAEALAMARKAGVEVERLPNAFAGGFADSAPLQLFGPRMIAGVESPRLGSVGLMRKDAELAQALAEAVGGRATLGRAVLAHYAEAAARAPGAAEADLSTLMRLFD